VALRRGQADGVEGGAGILVRERRRLRVELPIVARRAQHDGEEVAQALDARVVEGEPPLAQLLRQVSLACEETVLVAVPGGR